MARPSRLWQVAAALYVFINAAGAVFAGMQGERMHMDVHIGLLLLGFAAYPIWRRAQLTRQQRQQPAQLPEQRIDYLQQSVDAIALEVERIGEAQRFADKLRSEQGETPPPKKSPPEV